MKNSTNKPLSPSLQQERRTRHLTQLIKEAVITILAEQAQDLAAQQTQAAPPAPPVQSQQTPTSPTNEVPQNGAPENDSAPDASNITVDSLIERFNVIRGGKSFTDPEVYEQMTAYFDGMTDEEKVIMDKNLAEVGRVVISANKSAQPQEQQPQQQQQAPQAPQTAAPISPV